MYNSRKNKAQALVCQWKARCSSGWNRVNEAGIGKDGVGEVTVARSCKALGAIARGVGFYTE